MRKWKYQLKKKNRHEKKPERNFAAEKKNN